MVALTRARPHVWFFIVFLFGFLFGFSPFLLANPRSAGLRMLYDTISQMARSYNQASSKPKLAE